MARETLATKIDRRAFWDNKILNWDSNRYNESSRQRSWLDTVADKASNSIQHRQELAASFIGEACHGKRIVEIGCGTGRMAGLLAKYEPASYCGYDFSPVAIAAAQGSTVDLKLNFDCSFKTAEVEDITNIEAEIVFSLGLLDWLSDDQIENIFCNSRRCHCLHSFSEKRISVKQWLHKLYVYISYGHKNRGYKPRYVEWPKLRSLAESSLERQVKIYRDRRLAFGAFLLTLPSSSSAILND